MYRERTYYDERPDYGRPRLVLPESFRRRAKGRLAALYGDRDAAAWLPELERILQVHHACKPPAMLAKELAYDPGRRFHQGHILLITYGDMVQGAGPTPLADLRRFVERYAGDAINTIHLLPFFPYSSDRGFAVIDDRRGGRAAGFLGRHSCGQAALRPDVRRRAEPRLFAKRALSGVLERKPAVQGFFSSPSALPTSSPPSSGARSSGPGPRTF